MEKGYLWCPSGCQYRVLFKLMSVSVIYHLGKMMSILLVALIIVLYIKQLKMQMILPIIHKIQQKFFLDLTISSHEAPEILIKQSVIKTSYCH